MLQSRRPAFVVRNHLLQIVNTIRLIPDDVFPEKMALLSAIYNLISMIRRRFARIIAIRYIANIINKLETFLTSLHTT